MPETPDRLAAALADRYHIERELGRGGMATVYLAEDLRHGRRVAIKVLHPELSAVLGPDRFLSEIRTTAALQHPHILPLFDSGSADGQLWYAMPFVDGETLRARLTRERQLPIAGAVRIATEVADALAYAHAHGVVHRDIKPENVLLHGDHAMVADFGIALAVEQSGGERMTQTGLSLGTPHYMAPEQAMGERSVDARADIYALGVLTYEMLTGEPPFTGPTAQAIVAKVLTERPAPIAPKRDRVPPHVEDAVLTALEKLPADRFATAAAFAQALAADPSSRGAQRQRDRVAMRPVRFGPVALAMALGLMLVAGAAGYLLARRAAPAAPLPLGRFARVTWDPGMEIFPAISPDGRSVAYASGTVAGMHVYVRPVSGGRIIRLTDDSAGVQSHPRWSPDGTRVLFQQNNGVFSAPAAGGPARAELPPAAGFLTAAAWSPDGTRLAWATAESLYVREADGRSRPLAGFEEPNVCDWSPSGEFIACGSGNILALLVGPAFGNASPSSIVVCRVSDGRVAAVTDSVSANQNPVWSADGRWLYFVSNRDGPRDLYGVRISAEGGPEGPAIRLSTGLGVHTFSLSADGGRLTFADLRSTSNVWSASLADTTAPAEQVTTGSQNVENMNISSDGRWLYYDSDLTGDSELYRMRLGSGVAERLTTDPADDFAPMPSPDGRELVFHSWRGGASRDIYVMPLDGGPVQRVTDTPERQEMLASWSPDGSALAFGDVEASAMWIARRAGGAWGAAQRLDYGIWPVWSPDGSRIAFSTLLVDGSIGVMAADSGPARIISDGAAGILADKPVWSADGRWVLFRAWEERGPWAIHRVPADGSAPPRRIRNLDRSGGVVRGGWGYDGERAYFSVLEQESDVSVVEVIR